MAPLSVIDKSRLIEEIIVQDIGRKGVEQLHQAAVQLSHDPPTLTGATALYESVRKGGNVFIASGFTIANTGKCETDGPLGSIVVGRILNKMGAQTTFITDPHNVVLFERLARVAGLSSSRCVGFPIRHESAKERTKLLLKDLCPVALLAIERPGWNRRLVHHNMRGQDISQSTSKIDYVFDEARALKTPSIGIGDGGNEIGMGNILQTVREGVPFGSVCRCPCGGGIASITKVDHLVVSSVSNWGAYGLAAVLSFLAEIPLEHGPSEERRYVGAALEAGAVDGFTGEPTMTVDGLDINRNIDVVKRICAVLEK